MNEIDVIVGNIIREKRKELRLNQTQLGEKMGLSTMAISQYETGKRGMDLSTFFNICSLLKIDYEEVNKNINEYIEHKPHD